MLPPFEKVTSLPIFDFRPKDWSSSTAKKVEERGGGRGGKMRKEERLISTGMYYFDSGHAL